MGAAEHGNNYEGNWLNPEEVVMPDGLPKPTLWRVMVCPVQPKTMSKGGIALPATVGDAEQYLNYIGKVVAMGPLAGVKAEFADPKTGESTYKVNVGDWVAYGRYAGQRIEYKGVRLLLLNDDDVTLTLPAGPAGFKIYVE